MFERSSKNNEQGCFCKFPLMNRRAHSLKAAEARKCRLAAYYTDENDNLFQAIIYIFSCAYSNEYFTKERHLEQATPDKLSSQVHRTDQRIAPTTWEQSHLGFLCHHMVCLACLPSLFLYPVPHPFPSQLYQKQCAYCPAMEWRQ